MFSGVLSLPVIVMMAMAVSVFAFDLYVPSMPLMGDYFNCSRETIQLTLTAGITGSSLFTLILGPISDAIGRRKIMVAFQFIFFAASLICALAPSVEVLIIARFFQGMGGSAASVLSFAIFAEIFDHKKAAVYMAYLTTTITVSLVLAPMFGGYIAAHYSWQMNFLFLAFISSIAFLLLYFNLPETLKESKTLSFKSVMTVYWDIISNKDFHFMSFVPSLMIGGFVGFIATAVFYFVNVLSISPGHYGLYQAGIMFFNALFSYLAGKAIRAFSLVTTATIGMILFALGGLSFWATTSLGLSSPILLSACFSLYGAGLGFAFAAITAENMALFPKNSGATSAVIGFTRGTIISFSVWITGKIYAGTMVPVGIFILIATILCMSVYFLRIHKRMHDAAEAREHSE
ncbi:multidrug effflux MFS transporter [Candidatus Nucleicultrix amoebiphila]|jgi:DHA1 family bicyclomycin/chloramphenicol resistance-like MFS transporter|uniref:Major facilitator superfamily (MFS) profile domain-containing protein n=1 Tax=Candidatus Nucleicultrix amoebiphila FS5 TaxID=1414854 RepID=A0A1W6N4F6_9PROT|nr:multidrug effflux MFS transporter [Candidatus Nucleicultrix amoebiphila]ARN84734.1 hypothetical protein GQ61_04835 [Candidatus Nucleicultrix amoebiphila FS5]